MSKEKLSLLMARTVASSWVISICFAICMFLPTPSGAGSEASLNFKMGYLLLLPLGMWLACSKAYKALLLPKVIYARSQPTLKERMLSAGWFGFIAILLLYFLSKTHDWVDVVAFLLASILGFGYGWRITLLPGKALRKALMEGFVMSSFVFFVVLIILCVPSIINNVLTSAHEVVFLNPILDPFIKFISWFSFVVLMGGWIVAATGMFFAGILYSVRNKL